MMAYLKRKVDKYLADWKKDPDKKPLIIKGSRQVGKQNRSKDSDIRTIKT